METEAFNQFIETLKKTFPQYKVDDYDNKIIIKINNGLNIIYSNKIKIFMLVGDSSMYLYKSQNINSYEHLLDELIFFNELTLPRYIKDYEIKVKEKCAEINKIFDQYEPLNNNELIDRRISGNYRLIFDIKKITFNIVNNNNIIEYEPNNKIGLSKLDVMLENLILFKNDVLINYIGEFDTFVVKVRKLFSEYNDFNDGNGLYNRLKSKKINDSLYIKFCSNYYITFKNPQTFTKKSSAVFTNFDSYYNSLVRFKKTMK